MIQCNNCRKHYTNDYGERKIKNQNICMNCFIEQNRPYILCQGKTYDEFYGGSEIYRVISKVDNLRLHNIAYYEAHLPGIRLTNSFVPIHNWREVWNKMEGWYNPIWSSKHKGVLKRGICCADGNGIFAIVEDKKGEIYYIHGCW